MDSDGNVDKSENSHHKITRSEDHRLFPINNIDNIDYNYYY